MARKQPPLDEGTFNHPTCPTCEDRGVKNKLDDDTRWVVRQRWCSDALVDFSLVLQCRWAGRWVNVTRYSVAHANLHQYEWRFRNPDARVRHSFMLIDDTADMLKAYDLAIRGGLQHTEKWLTRWRTM